MKNVLIVYAHEEPTSFNGALRDQAVATLTEAGYHVEVSDLYKMNFKAVGDRNDFTVTPQSEHYKYQMEQRKAYENNTLTPDILQEQEKLKKADFVIFQFPLWWFSMPAILKGWVDRVFTPGFAYGGGKWFDRGGLTGKTAMISVTTGGGAKFFNPDGIYGNIHETLKPIHYGILYFVGFKVLPPFVVYSPARLTQEEREQILKDYEKRLLTWETTDAIQYPTLNDYDANYQLKR